MIEQASNPAILRVIMKAALFGNSAARENRGNAIPPIPNPRKI
jgi:hypothetical protein